MRKLLAILLGITALAINPMYGNLIANAENCQIAWGIVNSGGTDQASLERSINRPAAVALQGYTFNDPLERGGLDALYEHKTMPLLAWAPDGVPLSEIISGKDDKYIDGWAKILNEIGRPIMIAPMPGMDAEGGRTYSVTPGTNTNSDVIAAYRHIHDRITADLVQNVTWIWLVQGGGDIASVYPGGSYVDYLGSTVLNKSFNWGSFSSLYASDYGKLQNLDANKPFLVDFGSVEQGGNKAVWLQEASRELLFTYPRVKIALYHNAQNPGNQAEDYRLTTSLDSLNMASQVFGGQPQYCLVFDVGTAKPIPSPTPKPKPSPSAIISPIPSPLPSAHPTPLPVKSPDTLNLNYHPDWAGMTKTFKEHWYWGLSFPGLILLGIGFWYIRRQRMGL